MHQAFSLGGTSSPDHSAVNFLARLIGERTVYQTTSDEFEEPSVLERHADVALLGRLFGMATGDLRASVDLADTQVRLFGSAAAVINASPFLLKKRGLGATHIDAIRLVRDAMDTCLERRLERRPLISSKERALEYLHFRLAYDYREKVAVIFLTQRLRFLHYEEISEGSIGSTPYCVRTIAARALEVNAGALIVAHNHPSGNPDPTPEDRNMGMILQRLCADLRIRLLDNLVVSTTGSRSLMTESRDRETVRQLRDGIWPTADRDSDLDPIESA